MGSQSRAADIYIEIEIRAYIPIFVARYCDLRA